MNIIIAGSRTLPNGKEFTNYQFLKCECLKYLQQLHNIYNFTLSDVTVLSGKCKKGADRLGEQFAQDMQITVKPFHAPWNDIKAQPCVIRYKQQGNPYNLLAGINRNHQMVDYCINNLPAALIAFWNGKSSGTNDVITYAKLNNLTTFIVDL
jgi:hypothetical protein